MFAWAQAAHHMAASTGLRNTDRWMENPQISLTSRAWNKNRNWWAISCEYEYYSWLLSVEMYNKLVQSNWILFNQMLKLQMVNCSHAVAIVMDGIFIEQLLSPCFCWGAITDHDIQWLTYHRQYLEISCNAATGKGLK